MPMFEFKGLDQKGKSVKGVRDGDNIKSVQAVLRREGIFPTSLKEVDDGTSTKKSRNVKFFSKEVKLDEVFSRVSVEVIALATRQLAVLLQAGVPLIDSLTALIDQVENPALKRAFSAIRADVNEGTSLADAMAKHKYFTGIYISMVRAGETSGALEVVLDRLADFTEGQAQLRSKILGAMMYPAIMMCVAGLVLTVMLTVVIPRISQVFLNAKVELPLLTRILVGTSGFVLKFWWLVLIFVVAAVYLFLRWKKTKNGRALWDRFRLRLPVFGEITRLIAVARFARTLSTLLSSGVPLLTSLQIVRNVVDNDALEHAIDDVRTAVREGEDIARPLRRSGQFPPMVTHMIAIGEKSGQLEIMLGRVAIAYEQRVQTRVSMLMTLLEPFMILLMGGTVFVFVLAILVPILRMSTLVR